MKLIIFFYVFLILGNIYSGENIIGRILMKDMVLGCSCSYSSKIISGYIFTSEIDAAYAKMNINGKLVKLTGIDTTSVSWSAKVGTKFKQK